MSLIPTLSTNGWNLIASSSLSGIYTKAVETNFENLDAAFGFTVFNASSSSGTLIFNVSKKQNVHIAIDTYGKNNVLYVLSRNTANASVGVNGIPGLTNNSVFEVFGDSLNHTVILNNVDVLTASSTAAVFSSVTASYGSYQNLLVTNFTTAALSGTNLTVTNETTSNLVATNGTINTLTSTTITGQNLTVTATGAFSSMTATNSVVTNSTISTATITTGNVVTLNVSGVTTFSNSLVVNSAATFGAATTPVVVTLTNSTSTDVLKLSAASARTSSPNSYLSITDEGTTLAYPVSFLFDIFPSGHNGGMISSSSSFAFFSAGSSATCLAPLGVSTLKIRVDNRTLYIPVYTGLS